MIPRAVLVYLLADWLHAVVLTILWLHSSSLQWCSSTHDWPGKGCLTCWPNMAACASGRRQITCLQPWEWCSWYMSCSLDNFAPSDAQSGKSLTQIPGKIICMWQWQWVFNCMSHNPPHLCSSH